MPILQCPYPECTFETVDVEVTGAAALLNIHALIHSAPAPAVAAPRAPQAPKLQRPSIRMNITTEEWNAFSRRWTIFSTGTSIPTTSAVSHLLECASEDLGDIVLRAHPNFTTKPVDEALRLLKALAVVPIALGVARAELMAMCQAPDEPFRTFAARVQGKAETCEYTTNFNGTCSNEACLRPFNGVTYYTVESVRDVLLNGAADPDIRREALSSDGIQQRSINDIISFIETRETARDANPSTGTANAMSTYHRRQKGLVPKTNVFDTQAKRGSSPSPTDKQKLSTCPSCNSPYNIYRRSRRGWNTKPHSLCLACWRKTNPLPGSQNSFTTYNDLGDPFGQVTAISTTASTTTICNQPRKARRRRTRKQRNGRVTAVKLAHHIFSKGEWRRAQLEDHPRTTLHLTPERGGLPATTISGIVDSGAQSDVWGLSEYLESGYNLKDLSPVSLSLNAANKSPIQIEGAFFSTLSGRTDTGTIISHKTMVYVGRNVKGFYLSYSSMVGLGMLSPTFPSAGCAILQHTENGSVNVSTQDSHDAPESNVCSCPTRGPVPDRPKVLPFPCTPENNAVMEQWLIDRYISTVFNTCPHRQLPSMSGPPMDIHLREGATPSARTKAIPIPLHWEKQIHDDLLQDEALGIIERVPYGEPIQWCHRMVPTRKPDGTARRTIDMSSVNKQSLRESYHTESPFHAARRIPTSTWKTTTDLWNSFHSIEINEKHRHLTTFSTPFGLWRYKRAPQGFLSSGDALNRRLDEILANFPRKERVVDDTIHYDESLEEHWWRTIDLLTILGKAGVVIRKDKFKFARRNIDFAGFRISETRIDPLPKYLSAIEDFPMPESRKDVQSWFGLVNQVSNYAQLRDMMAPFRQFLSPSVQFVLTDELKAAFIDSKAAIITAIRTGVEIFDPRLPTCLRCDWSTRGVGYFLLQQHCSCSSGLPNCCPDGWHITLAGSRFLHGAEKRYAPIEGEALAVAWSLEQTRYFTLGCDNLLVITDHKPLTKLLGDRTLDEIHNTRLFRIKQRTMPWVFSIKHLPGSSNDAADAVSRNPSDLREEPMDLLGKNDAEEFATMAHIKEVTPSDCSISWTTIASETESDPCMNTLLQCVRNGFPANLQSVPLLKPYWSYRDALYELDNVILYNDRVIIPPSLRNRILKFLHSAHQGISSMERRARASVFWPGITSDLDTTRASCIECTKRAPSQPRLPPASCTVPSTPFEYIVADYCDSGGHHYLITADRLSGWPDVFKCRPGSPQSGAAGLIDCLRSCFARTGVPEELSSDWGPEFKAHSTNQFLTRWGVRHRKSSAYFPQSNGRAEVAVKVVKRLLCDNTGPNGSLNTDKFLQAILQLRNTPDSDCGLSPAQIIYGRQLRDGMSFINKLEKYSNPNIRQAWLEAWRDKEAALRHRFHKTAEALSEHSRPLPALNVGDHCYLQNQSGHHPKRWDRSGVVVEVLGYDSYLVKIDGSNRLTRRNRRFLRKFSPISSTAIVPTPGPFSHPLAAPPPAQIMSIPDPPIDHSADQEPTITVPHQRNMDHLQPDDALPPANHPPSPIPVAIPQPEDVSPTVPTEFNYDSSLPANMPPTRRPVRQKRPPSRFVPESGTWN